MLTLNSTKQWLKTSHHPIALSLRPILKSIRTFNLPLPLGPYKALMPITSLTATSLRELTRIFWWTPLFKSRLASPPKQLYLYCGMPYLAGSLTINMGENCRVSGQTTFTGRSNDNRQAQLNIGNNVGISWLTTIAVGTRVQLGDNVRIAGGCFLAGYPGHPINPIARAAGDPELPSQCGDIILEKNVWLGTNCTVLANVTIGENTVLGTGSVVTKSLPANVIAAGNPARVIRSLSAEEMEGLSHDA